MALSDYYDFGPLMAQLQQGGQGMSGGQNVPQNSWNGGQFVMPPVQTPGPYTQLAPYKGTAMEQKPAPAPARAGGLFGSLVNGVADAGRNRMQAGRPGGLSNIRYRQSDVPMFGRLAG